MSKIVKESLKDKLSGPTWNDIYKKLKRDFERMENKNPLSFYEEIKYENSEELLTEILLEKFFTQYFSEEEIPDMSANEKIFFGNITENDKLIEKGIQELPKELDDLYYLKSDKSDIPESGFYMEGDPKELSQFFPSGYRNIVEEILSGGPSEPLYQLGELKIDLSDINDDFWELINQKNINLLKNEILPGTKGEYNGEEIQLTKENILLKNREIFVKIENDEIELFDFLEDVKSQHFSEIEHAIILSIEETQAMETENQVVKNILDEIDSNIGRPAFTEKGLLINVTDFLQEIAYQEPNIFYEEYIVFIEYIHLFFEHTGTDNFSFTEPVFGFHGDHSKENFNEVFDIRLNEIND